LFLCFLTGFGVKLPIWPFYGWLPKAHVEASTNFSIFLSGVLVKFAFFGLFKCLLLVELEPTFYICVPIPNSWNCWHGFQIILPNRSKKISCLFNCSWDALINNLYN
jgi:formate hydrogenlyase subunit 3/multisubunit Na+/H+ antiporter MnhD subunit